MTQIATSIKFILSIAIFSIYMAFPTSAAAVTEPITFKEDYRATLRVLLVDFLKTHEDRYKTADFLVAHIDLNNDGIDEHILRRKNCSDRNYECLHLIIAEKPETLILLGRINSREIMIGQSYSHGIKDLLAFQNHVNEYKFNIYMWSPRQKKYIMSDE